MYPLLSVIFSILSQKLIVNRNLSVGDGFAGVNVGSSIYWFESVNSTPASFELTI